MQRPGIPLVLVCVLAGTAAAQTAAPAEPASAPSLEQRVTDQLAAQGIALSRRNLGVRIEQAEGPWTVSLVDVGNGRMAASIKVDVPEDPEAALPVVTRAAADLAEQVGHRVNELKFKLMSLRFDPAYEAPRQWQVFRGQLGEQLEAPEFFQMVGRDDLVSSYHRRRHVMIGSYAVAGLAFATAAVLTITSESPLMSCENVRGEAGQGCLDSHTRSLVPTIVALVVGVVGIGVGTYVYRHPQPIDEDDAKALADAYNQRLRGALGLHAAAKPPRLGDVALTPHVDRADASVVLGARF